MVRETLKNVVRTAFTIQLVSSWALLETPSNPSTHFCARGMGSLTCRQALFHTYPAPNKHPQHQPWGTAPFEIISLGTEERWSHLSGVGDHPCLDQSVQVWSEWCGLGEVVTAEGHWLTSQLFPGASTGKTGLFEEYLEHLCYPWKYFLREFLSLPPLQR